MCVCVGGGREGGERERGRERGRERERERETSGLSQSVRVFFFFLLILFHVMGLVLRRRNGTEKNTLVRTALFLPGIGVEKPDPRHALHWAFFLSQLSAPPIILGLRLLL